MIEEVRQPTAVFVRVPNSHIVLALSDERFEVRNIARILADRRGIQIVEDTCQA